MENTETTAKDAEDALVEEAQEDRTAIKVARAIGINAEGMKRRAIHGILGATAIKMHDKIKSNPFVFDGIFGYATFVIAVVFLSVIGIFATYGVGYAETLWTTAHPDIQFIHTLNGFVGTMAITIYPLVIIVAIIYVIAVNAIYLLGKTIHDVRED